MTIVSIYQNSIVYVMYCVFILLIAFFFLNIKIIAKQFDKIKRKTWIYLFIIFLAGFLLRFFVFPHVHLMYIDESLHLEAAKNINQKQQPVICEYMVDLSEECWMWLQSPPGWPFLISIVFLVFGMNNYFALYLSSILGCLSIILIFLLTYMIFRDQKVGLWSAFLIALTPIYVLWSNSATTNTASVFFVLLTMISFVIYMKIKERNFLILTTIILLFTTFVRFENFILVIILFLLYIKLSDSRIKSPVWRMLDLFYPLVVVVLLVFMITIESSFIKLSHVLFDWNAIDSYYLNFFYFLKDVFFNYIYLLLAALSLFLRDKKDTKWITCLFISFIFLFFLYLPIFIENRMALIPCLIIIILSAYSLERLCSLLIKYAPFIRIFIIIIFLFIFGFSLNSTYKQIFTEFDDNMIPFNEKMTLTKFNNKVLETESVMQIKRNAPENCYIISEFPMVLTSISNMKGLRTIYVLRNPEVIDKLINKGECVYYFYDGYCTGVLPISPTKESGKRCQEMVKTFDCIEERRFERGQTEYVLFRINQALKNQNSSQKNRA